MAKSKSSKEWLNEHFNDPYVKQAKADGYVSRAVYKLLQIQQKDHLLKPGMSVIDLGAAPGGWSQYASKVVGEKGRIIALDLLPLKISSNNIEFLQGDFQQDEILDKLLQLVDNTKVDLVLSDMSPNLSGVKAVDITKSIYLSELAFELCHKILKRKGSMLLKTFQGEGFDVLLFSLRKAFERVITRKPDASRPRSKEMYLLARNFKL